jgi:TIR domain/WD domain, G-beta repeat
MVETHRHQANSAPDAADAPDPKPAPASRGNTLSRIWDRVLYWMLQLAYFRFRYDIFISYRRHYKPYVTKLKQQLEHLGYRAFFDGEECPPGSALNNTLNSALKRSAALVLVGSRDVDSPYVTMEVTTFGTTGRSIIPIDIDGALGASQIGVIHERDLVWINETGTAFDVGVPSPDVVAGIEANFTYLKRHLRQRIEGLIIAALVVIIAGGSVWYARRNVKIARAEEQRAIATANAARRAAQEEQGQRAALLASEPGREHDAVLAGVLAVGPAVVEGRVPPTAAMYGASEAVAAAARSLPMDAGWTHDARITDDGRQIVTLGADGIRWWETDTGRMIRHVPAAADVRPAFCGESGLVVSGPSSPGSTPEEMHFRDLTTGKLVTSIRAEAGRAATACSRDRKWAVLDQRSADHLWDLQTKEDLGAFPDNFGSDSLPQFSADGTRLISDAGIFEIPSRRLVARLENPVQSTVRMGMRTRAVRSLSFFGSDRFIAAASVLGNVVIWNAEDGTVVHSFEVTKPRYGVHYLGTRERVHPTIDDMTISPDGTRIAVADIDNRITVWSTQPGTTEPLALLNVMAMEDAPQRLKLSADGMGQTEFGAVTDLRFFDEKTLIFITEAGRTYVLDLANTAMQRRRALQDPRFVTGSSAQKAGVKPAFAFDRRGRELVTFGCFAGVRRWSWSTDRFQDPDILRLAWVGDPLRNVLRDQARLILQDERPLFSTKGAAFSADNRFVVTEDDKGGRVVWDRKRGGHPPSSIQSLEIVTAGKPAVLEHQEPSESIQLELRADDLDKGVRSPSGALLANCCPPTVWSVADRRRMLTLPKSAMTIQFAPDEKDLAASSPSGYAVFSLDPAWYLLQACQILRDSDRGQTGALCPSR